MNQEQLSASVDYYKATMAQLALEKHPEAEVTFGFHNRTDVNLLEYVDPKQLKVELDRIGDLGFAAEEAAFLGEQGIFSEDYLKFLTQLKLPEVRVGEDGGELAIEATGSWPAVTFWETVVLAHVNERYFEALLQAEGLDPQDVYDEGNRRLDEKIAVLRANPDIKFADFGTRRRFSYQWHEHVIRRLSEEAGTNLVGTSNIWLAKELGLKPIGTFAHEKPMVYAAMNSRDDDELRRSHRQFLDDWFGRFGEPLSIVLTDTFGTEFFFDDFKEIAHEWRGLRQDSGDPFEFGQKAIEYYRSLGIDPTNKTIVFSDGLDIDTIVKLHRQFAESINVVFGWGTNLTNDLGPRALSIVMKATAANGWPTVKLSDNPAKFTGPAGEIDRYIRVYGWDTSKKIAVPTRY